MKQPPSKYEDFTRLVHDRHDKMSKSHQKIALYLTQNPNEVAVKPLSAIAQASGVHASSYVRFAQHLGFQGFKELQGLFAERLTTVAPGFEARQQALAGELSDVDAQDSFLDQLVSRDLIALSELRENTATADLEEAARILFQAENIFILGQLRSAPVADLLRYLLTMLGKKAVLLDASGGLTTHIAKTMTQKDALMAVSFRFYANEVVSVVQEAAQKAIPVIGISDSTLSPLAKHSRPLFVVPEREYIFSRSLAAPMCLAQAIVLEFAALKQGDAEPRIPTVTSE
ncbi:MAG: MurR/RpiR family transcriptional regulator [Pseudomonadota bacterium]